MLRRDCSDSALSMFSEVILAQVLCGTESSDPDFCGPRLLWTQTAKLYV